MRELKIFLASSDELREEREVIEKLSISINDDLAHRNMRIKFIKWENLPIAMFGGSRTQDNYNKYIPNCDLFIGLFHSKVGKYSKEEFDVAYDSFTKTQNPKIGIWFKKAPLSTEVVDSKNLKSLEDFKKELSKIGYFYSSFINTDDLRYKILHELKFLINGYK